MKVKQLPILNKEFELGCLGFYEMQRVKKCYFGGLANKKVISSGEFLENRVTKNLIVGNFYHDVMEKALTVKEKSELIKYGKSLINKIEKEQEFFIKERKLGSVSSWGDITNALRASILLFNSKVVGKDYKVKPKKLVSKDGLFKGVPDFYSIDNEKGTLIEYKSANLIDKSKTKQDYLEQIEFYSVLLFENFLDLQVLDASIISLGGQKTTKVFTREEVVKIGDRLRKEYVAIKKNSSLFSYEIENCCYCSKKELCETYKQEITSVKTDRDIYVVEGKFLRSEKTENGRVLFFDKFKVKLRNFVLELEVGNSYLLSNIFKVNDYFVIGVNSHVYSKN